MRDNCLARKASGDFRNKPRFSDSGLAQHGQQVTGSSADQVAKKGLDHRALVLPPDELRLEAALQAGGAANDVHQGNGRERLAMLERAGTARFHNDDATHQHMGYLSNQDFVGSRGLLETLGDTHSLASDESMSLSV